MTFFKKFTLVLAVSITYALHCPPIEIAKFSDVWMLEGECNVKYGNAIFHVSKSYCNIISSHSYAGMYLSYEMGGSALHWPEWDYKELTCTNFSSLEEPDYAYLPLKNNDNGSSYTVIPDFVINQHNTLLSCLYPPYFNPLDPSSAEAAKAWKDINDGRATLILPEVTTKK